MTSDVIVQKSYKHGAVLSQFFSAAAAAAAAAVNKDKVWNPQRLKKSSLTSGGSVGGVGNGSGREKQMPMRPRSVNSTFEKPTRGTASSNCIERGNKILGEKY